MLFNSSKTNTTLVILHLGIEAATIKAHNSLYISSVLDFKMFIHSSAPTFFKIPL